MRTDTMSPVSRISVIFSVAFCVSGCVDAPTLIVSSTPAAAAKAAVAKVTPQEILASTLCNAVRKPSDCERYWCGGTNRGGQLLNFGTKITYCGPKECLEAKLLIDYNLQRVACDRQFPDYVSAPVSSPVETPPEQPSADTGP